MDDLVAGLDGRLRALDELLGRLVALTAGAGPRVGALAVGGDGATVLDVLVRLERLARHLRDEAPGADPARGGWGLRAVEAGAADGGVDPPAAAAAVVAAADDLAVAVTAAVGHRPAGRAALVPALVPAVLVAELAVRGHDVAAAQGRPFPLDARLVGPALELLEPLPSVAPGLAAWGDGPRTLVVDGLDGGWAVARGTARRVARPLGPPVRLGAAAALLQLSGRRSLRRARGLRGVLPVTGRRPGATAG